MPSLLLPVAAAFALLLAYQGTPEQPTFASGIPGVIPPDTPVLKVWTGDRSADGIVASTDGRLLFAEQDASRISTLDGQGRVSVVVTGTNEAGALAVGADGAIFAVERLGQNTPSPKGRVTRYHGSRLDVLAPGFEGKPFFALRDLALGRNGDLYVTDGAETRNGFAAVYRLTAAGGLFKVAHDVKAANGVILSPDGDTLYVTDAPSPHLVAFKVRQDGLLEGRREFGSLDGGDEANADGLAVDSDGRVYVATTQGVQVLSVEGKLLGTIPTPRPATSVAFAGPRRRTLYIVGRGHDGPAGTARWARSIYAVAMTSEGPKGRAK